MAEALPEVNDLLLQAATPEQRELFRTSALDDYLRDAEPRRAPPRRGDRRRASPRSSRSSRAGATG